MNPSTLLILQLVIQFTAIPIARDIGHYVANRNPLLTRAEGGRMGLTQAGERGFRIFPIFDVKALARLVLSCRSLCLVENPFRPAFQPPTLIRLSRAYDIMSQTRERRLKAQEERRFDATIATYGAPLVTRFLQQHPAFRQAEEDTGGWDFGLTDVQNWALGRVRQGVGQLARDLRYGVLDEIMYDVEFAMPYSAVTARFDLLRAPLPTRTPPDRQCDHGADPGIAASTWTSTVLRGGHGGSPTLWNCPSRCPDSVHSHCCCYAPACESH